MWEERFSVVKLSSISSTLHLSVMLDISNVSDPPAGHTGVEAAS